MSCFDQKFLGLGTCIVVCIHQSSHFQREIHALQNNLTTPAEFHYGDKFYFSTYLFTEFRNVSCSKAYEDNQVKPCFNLTPLAPPPRYNLILVSKIPSVFNMKFSAAVLGIVKKRYFKTEIKI